MEALSVCPACEASIQAADLFCAACGTSTQVCVCRQCQETLQHDAAFCHRCGQAVAEKPASTRTATPQAQSPDAPDPTAQRSVTGVSAGRRFSAWLLDWVYGATVVVGGIFVVPYSAAVIVLVGVLLILSAFEVLGGSDGAGSPGKRSVGLRIQAWPQHDGSSPLGDRLWARFLLKHIILAIPILNLICLINMASREDHRAWYDQWAGTVVVKI